jgi:hypothetical protein
LVLGSFGIDVPLVAPQMPGPVAGFGAEQVTPEVDPLLTQVQVQLPSELSVMLVAVEPDG